MFNKSGVVRSAHFYDVIMIIIHERSPASWGSGGSAPGSGFQGRQSLVAGSKGRQPMAGSKGQRPFDLTNSVVK